MLKEAGRASPLQGKAGPSTMRGACVLTAAAGSWHPAGLLLQRREATGVQEGTGVLCTVVFAT